MGKLAHCLTYRFLTLLLDPVSCIFKSFFRFSQEMPFVTVDALDMSSVNTNMVAVSFLSRQLSKA